MLLPSLGTQMLGWCKLVLLIPGQYCYSGCLGKDTAYHWQSEMDLHLGPSLCPSGALTLCPSLSTYCITSRISTLRLLSDTSPICSCPYLFAICLLDFPYMPPGSSRARVRGQRSCLISLALVHRWSLNYDSSIVIS